MRRGAFAMGRRSAGGTGADSCRSSGTEAEPLGRPWSHTAVMAVCQNHPEGSGRGGHGDLAGADPAADLLPGPLGQRRSEAFVRFVDEHLDEWNKADSTPIEDLPELA